ncbi:hypothetical protein ACIP1T_28090 [Pseudomonas japonica]|uniref:hypothetical protein n=1 Tax=Pseudomonas japonica TaxID=256466 RepID=UPI0038000255
MPSIFDLRAADIDATDCPAFDQAQMQQACQARNNTLQYQRAELGKRWANDLQQLEWDADGSRHQLFPDPPGLLEPQDVINLRGALPGEFLQPINDSGLTLNGQRQMAQALLDALPAYQQYLQGLGIPQGQQRLADAEQLTTQHGYPPSRQPDNIGQPVFSMIPNGASNVLSTQPRYFRMLAWNLENFTRDRRPRGSAPIDSLRNQARVALVTEAMRAFDVDLLLVMETGYDVGPAMSAIANRYEARCGAPSYGMHPLVSPPTGALPRVANVYSRHNLNKRTPAKVLALRTLFEVYRVSARDSNRPLTSEQIVNGWSLLRQCSSAAAATLLELTADELVATTTSQRRCPHPQMFAWINSQIGSVPFVMGTHSDLPDLLYGLGSDLSALSGQWCAGQIDPSSQAFLNLYEDLCFGIQDLRMLMDTADEHLPNPLQRTPLLAYAQALELLMLFFSQSLWNGIPSGSIGLVFQSDQAEGDRIVLAVYLAAVSSALDFVTLDPDIGPLDGEVDNDVVLDALQRVGLITRHIETYGMVYRPPCEDALQRLFDIGVMEHGYRDRGDAQAANYDIVRGSLGNSEFSIQAEDGLLNWRSALQITVPVSETLNVPLALFHTRYSGTDAITDHYTGLTRKQRNSKAGKADKKRLTVEEAEVNARTDTLAQMAHALLPGHSLYGMPLIIGDFNIPEDYLEPSADDAHGTLRKQRVRQQLLDNMQSAGYLRHTRNGVLGSGHPLTTLKSFHSLASLAAPGSQPYDGVYQPFDFAQRRALVRSGVISLQGVVTAQALQETILGLAVAPGAEVDLDDTQGNTLNDQADSDDEPVVAQQQQMTVYSAVGREVARVYVACIRRMKGRIEQMKPWRTHLYDLAQYDYDPNGRYANRMPSAELLSALDALVALGETDLPQHIQARETWFVDRFVNDELVEYRTHMHADPLDGWITLFDNARNEAAGCHLGHPSLNDSDTALAAMQALLRNFELEPDVRKAVAYRAVVSDHLPQIIELDLEPGP